MVNIKHRKVIQISLGLHHGGALAALCDDGSMWIKDCPWDARDNWIRVVDVPAVRMPQPATAPARGEGMSERDPDSNDCEFIECDRCGKVLNGLSLWVVGDKDPKTICEECYKLKESNERFTKNTDA